MINGLPYINLEQYVNLKEFDDLHLEICKGIATARHLSVHGLQKINPGSINPDSQGCKINPLYEVYSYWQALPDNDLLKTNGKDLEYNQLSTYLKYSLGAYDAYYLYRLFEDADDNMTLNEINDHFPNLTSWIINFKTSGIFSSIHSSVLFVLDEAGIPWEHYDPELASVGLMSEFIHIKTDLDRPFYMIHPETKEKVYITTRVAWWNENVWHGGEPINRPTYTLRITGKFSDSFRNQILNQHD